MPSTVNIEGLGELNLRSLVDASELQRIQDEFAAETGIGIITVDAMGTPVTDGSRFTQLCQFLRRDPWIRRRCMSCDAHGGLQAALEGRPIVYQCHAALIDFAVPIIADQNYIGAILAGQVLLARDQTPPDVLVNPGGSLTLPDETQELYSQINVFDISKLEQITEAIVTMANNTLGQRSKSVLISKPDLFLGRLGVIGGRDHQVAPLLAGAHKELPLRPIADDIDSVLDPYKLTGNILRRDLAANIEILNAFLDRVLPNWSMRIKPGQLAQFEDVLIGIASSDSTQTGREISQIIIRRRLQRRNRALNRYECQMYCEKLLIRLHNLMEPELVDQDRSITTLLNEIEKNPTSYLTVSDAAAYLNWSESHFSRQFKKEVGETFIQYVTRKRLEQAKLMLIHTDRPISRIASQLGFNPENYFSRVFKKHEGMTPGDYRKTTKEEAP